MEEFIRSQLKFCGIYLAFELEIFEVNTKSYELIYEDEKLEVHSFPLKHRIETCGYRFSEKPKLRRINKEAVFDLGLEAKHYQALRRGEDVILASGEVLKNSALTFDAPASRSYAFCSDTMYQPSIVEYIKEVDLLYHESTFLEEQKPMAQLTMHSTAREAAEIAKEAKVGQLVLGHFSNRFKSYEVFLDEARGIFPNTVIPSALGSIELA